MWGMGVARTTHHGPSCALARFPTRHIHCNKGEGGDQRPLSDVGVVCQRVMQEAFRGGCCNQYQLAPLLDGTSGTPTALRAYDFFQWLQVLLEEQQVNTRIIDAALHPYPYQECWRHTTHQCLIIIMFYCVIVPHCHPHVAATWSVAVVHHAPQHDSTTCASLRFPSPS